MPPGLRRTARDYCAGDSRALSATLRGLAPIVAEYRAHYADLAPAEEPAFWLTETNIRGYNTFIESTERGETRLRVPHTRIDPVQWERAELPLTG